MTLGQLVALIEREQRADEPVAPSARTPGTTDDLLAMSMLQG